MSAPAPRVRRALAEWPEALEAAVTKCSAWKSVHVLRETGSTQDHARQLEVGAVVTTGRQTSGRGRLGRDWIDTGEDGLAMTLNVASQPSERLALGVAIAVAEAVEDLCRAATGAAPLVGLKWPNDLMIATKKIGGILSERLAKIDHVGIGVNCTQTSFPRELAARATSLALSGFTVDRLDLACAILQRIDHWLVATDEQIATAFARRDALCGTRAAFRTPEGVVEGVVVRIDPVQGLVVRTSRGDQKLAAATTSVLVPEDRL
ncbi:MAG: biotin--[acetyl-CoA-carboxylase] ligase [Phycisphaerales bacterium]|nr:biotin--[acetyl-CoA-carboxylase] ligase [Phycisphaerales bacterium]